MVKGLGQFWDVRCVSEDWLQDIFVRRLGNGGNSKFWLEYLAQLGCPCGSFFPAFQIITLIEIHYSRYGSKRKWEVVLAIKAAKTLLPLGE
jgi:hypothetical protein